MLSKPQNKYLEAVYRPCVEYIGHKNQQEYVRRYRNKEL